MKMRNETIKNVSELLKEDISEQFGKKEVQASMNGKKHFYIENKINERVKVEFIYHENADVLDYAIISYKILEGN